MAPTGASEQDFATSGYLEAFGHRFSGLIASRSSHICLFSWFSAGALTRPGWVYYSSFRVSSLTDDGRIRFGVGGFRNSRRRDNKRRRDYGLMLYARVICVQFCGHALRLFLFEKFGAGSGPAGHGGFPTDHVRFVGTGDSHTTRSLLMGGGGDDGGIERRAGPTH